MIVPPPVASSLIFGAHRRGEHIAREQHIFRSTSANQGQVSPNVSRAKDVQRRAPKKMAQRVAPLPAASNTTTTTPIWRFRTSSVSGGSTPCAEPILTAWRGSTPALGTGAGHRVWPRDGRRATSSSLLNLPPAREPDRQPCAQEWCCQHSCAPP